MPRAKGPKKKEVSKGKQLPLFPCFECKKLQRDESGASLSCALDRPEFWEDMQGYLKGTICPGY